MGLVQILSVEKVLPKSLREGIFGLRFGGRPMSGTRSVDELLTGRVDSTQDRSDPAWSFAGSKRMSALGLKDPKEL